MKHIKRILSTVHDRSFQGTKSLCFQSGTFYSDLCIINTPENKAAGIGYCLECPELRLCTRWAPVIKKPPCKFQTEWGAKLKAQEGEATRAAPAHLGGDSHLLPSARSALPGSAAVEEQHFNLGSKAATEECPPLCPAWGAPASEGVTKPSTTIPKGRELETVICWKPEKESHATTVLASDQAPALTSLCFIQGNAGIPHHFSLRHSTLTGNYSQYRTRSDNLPVPKH